MMYCIRKSNADDEDTVNLTKKENVLLYNS